MSSPRVSFRLLFIADSACLCVMVANSSLRQCYERSATGKHRWPRIHVTISASLACAVMRQCSPRGPSCAVSVSIRPRRSTCLPVQPSAQTCAQTCTPCRCTACPGASVTARVVSCSLLLHSHTAAFALRPHLRTHQAIIRYAHRSRHPINPRAGARLPPPVRRPPPRGARAAPLPQVWRSRDGDARGVREPDDDASCVCGGRDRDRG